MNFYLQLSNNLRYIMRITLSQLIVFFVLTGVSYAGETNAQGVLNNPVKLSQASTTLNNALKRIEKAANVKFVYSRNIINADQMVSVDASNEKLSSVLDDLLHSRGIKYEVLNQQIVLSPLTSPVQLEHLSSVAVELAKIDITVTGRVTDANGDALVGVSVKLKGNTLGTTTNVSGDFSVIVPENVTNPVLVFSYIGFATQEIAVNGRTRINVQLADDTKTLEEVVVVGYNVVRKSDVTGSVVSVGAEEIRSRPVTNALQAIQGKAAGVDITSNERPGEIGRVQIRGVRSLTAQRDPLYVVDGIPLAAGGIEAINPNDIESIDILKDASATAVYGSRGANGVVLINTKRGKAGALSLNYVGTSTIENMVDRTDMMNSAQYVEFRRDAKRRAGNYPEVATLAADQTIFAGDTYALANIEKGWQNGTWDGSLIPTTDWTGKTLQTGLTHDHTLSASGGTDKLKAYGSFGYLNQEGTQLGQDYERFSAKFSADVSPVKWFNFGGNITATYGDQNFGFSTSNATGPGNLYFAAQGMLPYAIPFDDEGNRINLPGGDVNIQNPIGEENYNINQRRVLRTLGSLYAEVNIIEGLKYRMNFGPDFYNWKNGRYMDENSVNRGAGTPGSTNYAQLEQISRVAYTLDNLIYYNKSFGTKHNLGATLLQSASSYRSESSLMNATKLPWDSQKWYQLGSVAALDRFSTDMSQNTLNSYMGRFNYDYAGKYFITASGRWDGASQLAEGNKWDFFPSAALSWRLDQETFMQGVSWVDQLKLRVGFGSTGNAGVGSYTTKGRLETLYYTWGNSVVPGYVSSDASLANPVSMPNYDLGWEHTTQWNFAVDFDFLKGRVAGSLDFYSSKTDDLLMLARIPSVLGYVTSLYNVGSTANKGVELSLNTVNIKKNDFNWSSTINFAANKDKIVMLSNGKQDDVQNNWYIGERLNISYDFVKEGIWQNTPEDLAEIAKFAENGSVFTPGTIKVADLNGDYKIDANNDRRIVGNTDPDWTAGLTNTFNYKNWDLSVFMFGRFGFTAITGAESLQGRFAQRVVDYWTPTNPTNDYPAPNYNSASGDPYRNSMNYQDGSFIKVRNISLGYVLPKAVTSKMHLSSVRLYAQALNPGLLYSKVDWIDPDLGGSTFNRGFVFGLNVGF